MPAPTPLPTSTPLATPTPLPAPTRLRVAAVGLLALSCLAGCALGSGSRTRTIGGSYEVVRVGHISLAGQPNATDLADIADAGYRTVLTLRAEDEISWDEMAAVNAAGMRFARVPLKPETIEVGVLTRIRSIIEMSPKPVLIHCSSGNRSALVWGMLEAGERSDEEILRIAREAGMKERDAPILEEHLARVAAGTSRMR